MRLLIATGNQGKLVELQRLLGEVGANVELVGLRDVAPYTEPVEDGATFAENALIKARAGVTHTGIATVADDSGLAVDALNGMPGVLSARWSGQAGSAGADEANLRLVLAQTADVPDERRGAAFHCAAALVLPDGAEHVVEGRMDGALIHEPRGDNGFGYDPIFVPRGHTRTTAEMTPAEKDAISHRGKALWRLTDQIARSHGLT